MESVNWGTVKLAPAKSMIQLGNCVQRLIATLVDNYIHNTLQGETMQWLTFLVLVHSKIEIFFLLKEILPPI